MKDLDFDELDKAVNSLMGRNAQKDTAAIAPATPPVEKTDMPLTAAPVSPGVIKPKSEIATNPDSQPAVTPQPVNTPASSPISLSRTNTPATRRGGKFMDVVPKKPTPSLRPVSRQGVGIVPRTDAGAAAELPVQPTTPVQPVPNTQVTPVFPEKTAPANEWPDPIDLHAAKQAPAPSTEQKADVEQPAEKPTDTPLSSPFLPDAKVEKRPLGGPSPLTPMVAPEHELMTPAVDDSHAQLPAKPSDVAPETPEEFNDDLMKVESDTHMGVPKTDETHPVVESMAGEQADEIADEPEASKGSRLPEEESTLVSKEDAAKTETEETVSEPPTGRISIPQQYKEQESSGDTTSGAIYDTDTYHQPLAHPAKKSSGWWWVLWIVLIVIVGAGAGVALYFLGIM